MTTHISEADTYASYGKSVEIKDQKIEAKTVTSSFCELPVQCICEYFHVLPHGKDHISSPEVNNSLFEMDIKKLSTSNKKQESSYLEEAIQIW